MPSKTKTRNAAIAARTAALPKLPKELLDQITAYDSPVRFLENWISEHAAQQSMAA